MIDNEKWDAAFERDERHIRWATFVVIGLSIVFTMAIVAAILTGIVLAWRHFG